MRGALHAAADFAFGSETHYRFFGFSQANIAFDADRNFDGKNYCEPGSGDPATVSTSFLWHSLRSSNVPLEGSELEALLREYFHFPGKMDESDLGAEPPLPGSVGENDGLYHYSTAERKVGATFIYDETYDAIAIVQDQAAYDVLGWSAEVTGPMLLLFTRADPAAQESQRVKIANQFTNCFGYDLCGASDDTDCPCTTTTDSEGNPVEECPPGMTSQERAACDPAYVREHPGPVTNTRVIVTASVNIVESADCDGEGNVFDDPESDGASFGPAPLEAGETTTANPVARVPGGDFGSLSLTFSNNAGDTIIIKLAICRAAAASTVAP